MRVPYSWLCDFVPLQRLDVGIQGPGPSSELVRRLADAFNDLGLVVEEIEWVGTGLEDVVVAEVLEIHAIDGADKIRRILVDAKEKEPLQIVCGAFNFAVGDKVPLAKLGAILPGDFVIEKRQMRGVDSFGMLCSPIELRLGNDKGGLMILPRDAVVGMKIADALGIVRDVVFDLAIENNRPDANCVMGIARDLAAWLMLPFSEPAIPSLTAVHPEESGRLSQVRVMCPEHCDRLLVALFDSVEPLPTPALVVDRINKAGMRAVSPIVDISNYLMLELGQPTHPYDAESLAGGVISIRLAKPGEPVVTLDGAMRTLGLPDARGRESTDVLIVDGQNCPVGLAGIMGGEESEIKESTTSILLELAHFSPMTIARTSKRLGLRSEASARFERGVDPRVMDLVLARFSEMLGGPPTEIVEVSAPGATDSWKIDVRVNRVNEILGTAIEAGEISSILESIGFRSEGTGEGVIRVTVPTNRPDVEREIDVIEEVARQYGYRRIDKVRPHSKNGGYLTPAQKIRRQIGLLAAGTGFYEVWSATLLAPGEQERFGDNGPFLEVENPLAREESVLRRSLLPGLTRALRFNQNRKEENIRLFENGKVFSGVDGEISESERVGFLMAFDGDSVRSAMSVYSKLSDFFSLARVVIINGYELGNLEPTVFDESALSESWHGLHPTRSAYLLAEGKVVGHVGEVDRAALASSGIENDRRVGYLELDFERLTALISRNASMIPISQFPIAAFDLAFEVPDVVGAREIEYALSSEVSEYVVSARLFDVFRGGNVKLGSRSLAFAMRLSAMDRTLSDQDISVVRSKCIELVESRFGAKLR